MENPNSYSDILAFSTQYMRQGFMNINREESSIMELEKKLRGRNQFFYVEDLLKFNVLFSSAGSLPIIGVKPEAVDPYTLFERGHPEDLEQFNRAKSKFIKLGQSLYIEKQGIIIVSLCTRQKDSAGNYVNMLIQQYGFFSDQPRKTVYAVIVATVLNPNTTSKYVHHFYCGNDPSMFRYPDEVLLKSGNIFTYREMEIIKLIASGVGSEQIADKLFLSVNTVNTHRRNILIKSKSSSTHELIIELQKKGIL